MYLCLRYHSHRIHHCHRLHSHRTVSEEIRARLQHSSPVDGAPGPARAGPPAAPETSPSPATTAPSLPANIIDGINFGISKIICIYNPKFTMEVNLNQRVII